MLVTLATAGVTALALFIVPSVSSAAEHQRIPSGRTAVGDSVMEGAASNLRRRGFAVDTAISRQVSDGIAALRAKRDNGNLRRQVVAHLGTNGTFSSGQCKAIRKVVGKHRNLVLLTVKVPRPWAAGNNRVISRCAKRYSNVYLLDWQRYVKRHHGLVYGDGYHLTAKGARKYAALVDHRVDALP